MKKMLDIELDLAVHAHMPPDLMRDSSSILYWHSAVSKDLKEQREKEKAATTSNTHRPRVTRR